MNKNNIKLFSGNREIADFITKNYHHGFHYEEFAQNLTANSFDPNKWAELFAKSGAKFVSLHEIIFPACRPKANYLIDYECINMNIFIYLTKIIKIFINVHFRYVVLTAKHHDGFTLFRSGRPGNWNSVDVGPRTDVVKVLSDAVRNHSLKFGIYYSLLEWNNTLFLSDIKTQNTNNVTIKYIEDVLWPDIKRLVNTYTPSVFWADGDWDANYTYWKSSELLAWLYNESPVKDEIVVNDRWGWGTNCRHGDFYNCDDRFNPSMRDFTLPSMHVNKIK